jgi:hypothetical protein
MKIIGVDFDNTLIVYDDLMLNLAVQRGLISAVPFFPHGKKEIRDAIRLLPEGEIQWQKLQAAAYGARINEAPMAEGAADFFKQCRQAGANVYVISHKTELAGYDETNTNLREAALNWMKAKGFFRSDGLGLSPEAVYFGSTRQEKIDHIRNLGCTHFIDDLEETFLEESFPPDVEKILYAPHPLEHVPRGVRVAETWKHICEHLFDTRY